MSNKLKKLFNTIINKDNEEEKDYDEDYKLIENMEDLIIGSYIKYKIASKILYSGFLIMYKKSMIRDQNMIILKTKNNNIEIPFYKYKVYQKDFKNIKKKSIFENKEMRNKYLRNISVYLNKNNNN